MGRVTFDPGRVALLARELHRVAERLGSFPSHEADDDVARLTFSARRLVDTLIAHVDSALVAIHDMDARSVEWSSTTRRIISPEIATQVAVSIATTSAVARAVSQYDSWARSTNHWWTQATTKESTRSDDILHEFHHVGDPTAAGLLIDALPQLELLVTGTADLSLVESLWTAATDPATTSSPDAGRRIQRLLDVVHGPRSWELGPAGGSIDPVERARREVVLRELAARISAPWQLHFSRRDAVWPWSGVDGTRRLHHMSELESASDILVRGLASALRLSLENLPDDPTQRTARIDAVAEAVGTSLEVRRLAEVDRSREASDLDTLREILGALALDGPWPVSMIVDAGARWVGDFLDTSDARIREATLENLHHREVLASLAVIAVFTSTLRRTRSSVSGTSPTTVDRDARTNSRAHLADELRHTYQAIDNAAARGQSLAQLAKSTRP